MSCQMGLWTLDCSGTGVACRFGIYEGSVYTVVSGWTLMFSVSRFGLLLLGRASFSVF